MIHDSLPINRCSHRDIRLVAGGLRSTIVHQITRGRKKKWWIQRHKAEPRHDKGPTPSRNNIHKWIAPWSGQNTITQKYSFTSKCGLEKSRGVARGWPGWPKPPQSHPRKNIRQKRLILFTTFTLHIKLHSQHQWRRNALNVLWCYKSTEHWCSYWPICHHCSTGT